MFILADACKKAKSLHQQDVLDALRNELLDTPYRPFRFAPNHFEEKPMIRVISVYDLMQVMKNIPADSEHTENGVPPKTDERK